MVETIEESLASLFFDPNNTEDDKETVDKTSRKSFYTDAKDYWSGVSPTVDGMLGGFASISPLDISGSAAFIQPFIQGSGANVGTKRALDCGAGIGRITKHLLLTLFDSVDMVELNKGFLDEAPEYLGQDLASRVERYIDKGLQEFTPDEGRYDVIWCQWVMGQLRDQDLIDFLVRCVKGLNKNGIIIIKENIAGTSGCAHFDRKDSSVTRPRDVLVALIEKAGLKILKEELQENFPKNIYDVRMFALQA